MRLGALNFAGFFKAQPDTPAKLAGFAYAFEALECAAYELLARTARRAGDEETAALAERILAEERAAAEKVAGTWDAAAEVALREQDVAAT
jgi:ferritin-like metal-binding protein YciE